VARTGPDEGRCVLPIVGCGSLAARTLQVRDRGRPDEGRDPAAGVPRQARDPSPTVPVTAAQCVSCHLSTATAAATTASTNPARNTQVRTAFPRDLRHHRPEEGQPKVHQRERHDEHHARIHEICPRQHKQRSACTFPPPRGLPQVVRQRGVIPRLTATGPAPASAPSGTGHGFLTCARRVPRATAPDPRAVVRACVHARSVAAGRSGRQDRSHSGSDMGPRTCPSPIAHRLDSAVQETGLVAVTPWMHSGTVPALGHGRRAAVSLCRDARTALRRQLGCRPRPPVARGRGAWWGPRRTGDGDRAAGRSSRCTDAPGGDRGPGPARGTGAPVGRFGAATTWAARVRNAAG
jgi:hypothetical protein